MTDVVFVGKMYSAGLEIGGGPAPPAWGGRPDHIWGRPPGVGGGPVYPGHPSGQPVPPGGPVDPGWGGGWGGGATDPGWGVSGPDKPRPPIQLPPGGAPVEDYEPLPPPEDIYSQYVVSVWNPKTASWTTKSYPPPAA